MREVYCRPCAFITDFDCQNSLEGHSAEVNSVAITRDGRFAVSASSDKSLKVWDLANKTVIRSLEGHSDAVETVIIADDGQIVSGSSDCTIRVWDWVNETPPQILSFCPKIT